MKKKILVTGCTGGIGFHICKELFARGHNITGIDISNNGYSFLSRGPKIIIGDIRTISLPHTFDTVYHLAGLSSVTDENEMVSINIGGTRRILHEYHDSRVIITSSLEASENKTLYHITNRSCEHLINLHPNAVAIRFGQVFGEDIQDSYNDIAKMCYHIKHNKVFSWYNEWEDYIYVKDLVNEMICIGESKIRGQTDTGYGKPVKTGEVYKAILKLTKKESFTSKLDGKRNQTKPPVVKHPIREPQYGMNEGLRRTVRSYMADEDF